MKKSLFWIAVVSLFPTSPALPSPTQRDALVFIVNKDNPVSTVTVTELVDFYQKRQRRWPDGTTVRFIDQESGSAERKSFDSQFLKQSEGDVDLFWINQKIATGDSEPIQASSDSMVIRMVQGFKGAVGYVSASARVDSKAVKILKVSDAPIE